jgi:RNA polymerase sigma factor (sigma-70 family)
VLTASQPEARYREVFTEHHPRIYAYFRRRIDPETARDCTAETFLVAWRRLDTMPGDGGELRWLYMIAHNVLRNAYRAKRRSLVVLGVQNRDIPDTAESPEAVVVRREEEAEVLLAVSRLNDRDREILLLSVWEELPRDDIAAIVGCSPHAASQRLHRASKRLARELDRVVARPVPSAAAHLLERREWHE